MVLLSKMASSAPSTSLVDTFLSETISREVADRRFSDACSELELGGDDGIVASGNSNGTW